MISQHVYAYNIYIYIYPCRNGFSRPPPPPVIQKKKILWSVLAGSGMSRPSPFPSIILSPTLPTTLERGFA